MINKTFRLFISSTFNDFILERNILNDEIFPVIDEHCQNRGYNFQIIDLRWGVNNESALSQNTLAICLDEVRRCKTLSPKPNFLILAGERYGWIPLPAKITTDDFQKLISDVSDNDRSILVEWYLFDENELGGEYHLKARTGEYIDDDVWQHKEKELYDILMKCSANSAELSAEFIERITSSATEQEILEGLLECDGAADNTITVFRYNYPDADKNQSKIIKLRNRIVAKMKRDDCEDNIINIEWSNSQSYQDKFKNEIINMLKKNISNEIERLEQMAKDKENDTPEQIKESVNIYFERDAEIDYLQEYIRNESKYPLFLLGESGCGKTTLLAELIKQEKNDVFYIFYGWTEESYTLLSSLIFLIRQIKNHYEIAKNLDTNETNMSEMLYQAIYSIPKGKKATIIIDGMDLFHDIHSIKECVFPAVLPDNVKLIISSADYKLIDRFSSANKNCYELTHFDGEKSVRHFYALMNYRNRCISPVDQKIAVHKIIENGATPLQLKLLAEECSGWRSSDKIDDLPTSVDAFAQKYILNMYEKFGHNKELVLYAMALIAASPYGIKEDELQLILLRFGPVKEYFVSEDRYKHNTDKLPFVIWSRLFYDLKGCLTLVKFNEHIVVRFAHQIFLRVIVDYYPDYYSEARRQLIEYYESQGNYLIGSFRPNSRKASSLPALLKQDNQIERLKDLYLNLEFVDAVIKTERVDEAISDLRFLIYSTHSDEKAKGLASIYTCLQNNRVTLSCYTSEFYSCFKKQNNSKEENAAFLLTGGKKVNPIFFPYSLNSHIKWDEAGTRYAAYYNSYVYICDYESNEEICKIYLEPQNGNRLVAKDVLWLENDLVAVITYGDILEIYSFQDGIPNLQLKLQSTFDDFIVGYSRSNKIILMQDKDKILAYNIEKGDIKYSVQIKHKYKISFEVIEQTNTLTVKDTIKRIRFFNASNGEFIKSQKISLKRNIDEVRDFLFCDYIHQIDENKWFFYNPNTRKRAVLDNGKKSYYLFPPMFEQIKNQVIGKHMLLLVYTDKIILLELFGCYKMKWLSIPYINDVAWVVEDNSVSVLTNNGLFFFDVSDFKPFSQENDSCMITSRNVVGYIRHNFRILSNVFKALKTIIMPLIQQHNALDYSQLFQFLSNEYVDLVSAPKYTSTASMIVSAPDGKQAVLYEEDEVIIVFDLLQRPIIHIDKLKLSLQDNILKLVFSPDSNYLLIWRNDSIQIINIITGKQKINIDLLWRPALDVEFCDDTQLNILFCNGQMYTININSFSSAQLPDKLVEVQHSDAYAGPYNYYLKEKHKPFLLLDLSGFDLEELPNRWFRHQGIYRGNKYWLYFKNGTFFLNGDTKDEFEHEFYDFQRCLEYELLRESKPIRMYLHEKNDLCSTLYEINDEYLVLVSRLLNSVIVFDLNDMCVHSAYKYDGNIIGCSYDEANELMDIILDRFPYQEKIHFSLTL